MDRSKDKPEDGDKDPTISGDSAEKGGSGDADSGSAEAAGSPKFVEGLLKEEGPPRWAHNQNVGFGKIKDALKLTADGLKRQITYHQKDLGRYTSARDRMMKNKNR